VQVGAIADSSTSMPAMANYFIAHLASPIRVKIAQPKGFNRDRIYRTLVITHILVGTGLGIKPVDTPITYNQNPPLPRD
jgi:hypothetical protein